MNDLIKMRSGYQIPPYLWYHPMTRPHRRLPISQTGPENLDVLGPALAIDSLNSDKSLARPEQAYHALDTGPNFLLFTHIAYHPEAQTLHVNLNAPRGGGVRIPYVRHLRQPRNSMWLKDGLNDVLTVRALIDKATNSIVEASVFPSRVNVEQRFIPPAHMYLEGLEDDMISTTYFDIPDPEIQKYYLRPSESEALTWCTNTYHVNDALYVLNNQANAIVGTLLEDQSIPALFSVRKPEGLVFSDHGIGESVYAGVSAPVRRSSHGINMMQASRLLSRDKRKIQEARDMRTKLRELVLAHSAIVSRRAA